MNAHVMNYLDHSGHVRVSWSEDNEAEVRTARETFERMTGQGYAAFRIRRSASGDEKQGAAMAAFDHAAEEILLTPQLVGG